MHSHLNLSSKGALFLLLIIFFTVTLVGCGDSKEASEVKNWYHVNPAAGSSNFVVIDKVQWENADIYRSAITEICEKRKGMLCVVSFWKDASLVPQKLPMTDAQSDGMVAGWNSNAGTLIWSCENKNADPEQCFSKN